MGLTHMKHFLYRFLRLLQSFSLHSDRPTYDYNNYKYVNITLYSWNLIPVMSSQLRVGLVVGSVELDGSTGSSVGSTGSSVGSTGSSVVSMGSLVGSTGSSVGSTGSSVGSAGSSVGSAGSSVGSIGSVGSVEAVVGGSVTGIASNKNDSYLHTHLLNTANLLYRIVQNFKLSKFLRFSV